ncbi:MAG: hypothetical protein AAGI52_12380 [Bacteroidota bacterium]
MRSLIFLVLATLVALPVSGQSVSPVIEGALEVGGDTVSELFFEDGTTQTQSAGQGGTLAGGVLFRPSADSPFGLRTTVGVKALFNASNNANTRVIRFPLEAVASVTFGPGIEIGAGPVAHLGAELAGDGFVDDRSFGTPVGVTVEAGYKWAALTYTAIRYTDDATDEEFDASNVGISFRYAF